MKIAPQERFMRYVAVDAHTGCHNWIGATDKGYGRFWLGSDRATYRAHRWAYEQAHGPVPDGLVLDHLCRNPRCVNPSHLEAVTQRENTLRGNGNQHAFKTHCKRGHEFTEANTRLRRGWRNCRACERARERAARSSAKEKTQ